MPTDNADDLVPFRDVRVVSSTGPALLCRIGGRTVWLPRRHVSGRLCCAGDRGELLIRRWVARERHLMDVLPPPAASRAFSLLRLPPQLHIVRAERRTPHAE